MNKQLETLKKMKKLLALVSATACVGSFAGCSEGWQSDDHEEVKNKVSAIMEYQKEKERFSYQDSENSKQSKIETSILDSQKKINRR